MPLQLDGARRLLPMDGAVAFCLVRRMLARKPPTDVRKALELRRRCWHYFFNTMFYPTLVEQGYARVRRHTAAKHKIDIFAQALIFVPIHCGTNHWTLAVVNSLDKRFEYFDSCGGPDNGVLRNVRSYVAAEMKDKRRGAIWDDSDWTDHVWKYEDGTPQQGKNNGSDCGLFMLKTADLLAQNARVDVEQVLSPKHPKHTHCTSQCTRRIQATLISIILCRPTCRTTASAWWSRSSTRCCSSSRPSP